MTRHSLSRALSMVLATVFLAACGDSSGPDEDDVVVRVEITPETPSLAVGDQIQLEAVGLNADNDEVNGTSVSWSSSAAGVASITGNGLLTGVSTGSAEITATIDGESATVTATVAVPCVGDAVQPFSIGEFRLVAPPLCMLLDAAGNETYLVGVQSISQSVGVVTPVTFGVGGDGTALVEFSPVATSSQGAPSAGTVQPLTARATPAQARRQAHRTAEHALRARELAQMNPRFDAGRRGMQGGIATYSTALRMADVGDTLDLRYPDPEQDLCNDFAAVRGVVRHISDRGIFVADVENPAGGYVRSDYVEFGELLDDRIYATEADYFGPPTDQDGNGRIIVLFTQEVNRREGILGMVVSADLFSRSDCPSSNEGEIYYGRAPDPDGDVGVAYPVESARMDAPGLIAHELTHIIQFGRRLDFPGATAFQELWELESQATLAEEVVGHDFTNRTVRQNYGFDVAWENCGQDETGFVWYCDKFSDLALYYGFQSQTSRADGAPEQCSWLGRESQGNDGPCIPQRMVYTGWSFLRWLSDHYGPQLGSEQLLHRRLIENSHTGFATITDVIGQPIDQLLGRWAATLYTDDRFPGMHALLQLPSWDLHDIEQGLVDTAHLQPYQHSFGTFSQDVSVRAGSSAYFLLTGSRTATRLRATTQTGATLPSHMRMWIVRLQ